MATPIHHSHARSRTSQSQPRPEGLLRRAGKMVGQLFGFNATQDLQAAAANRRDNFQTQAGYGVRVERAFHKTVDGKVISQKINVPDQQLVAFLNQVSSKGIS